MGPRHPVDEVEVRKRPDTTTWILIVGLVLILAFGVYLATRGGGGQDKLTNPQVASG